MHILGWVNLTSVLIDNDRIAVIGTLFFTRPGLLDRSQRTRGSTNLTQRRDMTPVLVRKTQLAPPTDLSNGI